MSHLRLLSNPHTRCRARRQEPWQPRPPPPTARAIRERWLHSPAPRSRGFCSERRRACDVPACSGLALPAGCAIRYVERSLSCISRGASTGGRYCATRTRSRCSSSMRTLPPCVSWARALTRLASCGILRPRQQTRVCFSPCTTLTQARGGALHYPSNARNGSREHHILLAPGRAYELLPLAARGRRKQGRDATLPAFGDWTPVQGARLAPSRACGLTVRVLLAAPDAS